jgi:ribA/ribD-fused uncharacterized protein
MTDILFYATGDDHGFLSNFHASPFELRGKRWATVEHCFQAGKFAGTEHEEEIRLIASPMVAARKGRSRKLPLRPDWDSARDEVMLAAVTAKFAQNPELAEKLLATGDAKLIEHTARDSYWADGGDGSGRNKLGQILMTVRAQLRAKQG